MHSFAAAWLVNGFPAAVLTDNGAVFSGASRRGKVLLELELERLGIRGTHSRPNHPQTCGKVERFHQTLKRYLAKQAPARSLSVLQAQLDAFRIYYNQRRPHRALGGHTPLVAFNARLKARPSDTTRLTHCRVRRDRVDETGCVTLRYLSRLRHIGLGRAYKHQPVTLLIAGRHVRIVGDDGTLIRELAIDPTRNYQPRGVGSASPRLGHHDVRQVATMS